NAYAAIFRVNSVFWDPSVYGRFLVLAMLPSVLLVVLGRSLRWSLVGIAVLAGIAVAQPQVRRSLQHHTTSGLNSASSGRFSLVANGIRIAKAHPVRGVGVGGFKRAYAERVFPKLKGKEPKTAASHDTPVTVAAETGVV